MRAPLDEKLRDAVLDALRDGDWHNTRSIALRARLSVQTVGAVCSELRDEGTVQRSGRRWKLTLPELLERQEAEREEAPWLRSV